jgi:hypothetical protein
MQKQKFEDAVMDIVYSSDVITTSGGDSIVATSGIPVEWQWGDETTDSFS